MGFGPNWGFLSQIEGHSICLKKLQKARKKQKKTILSLKEPQSTYGVDGTTSIAGEFMFYTAKKNTYGT